MADLTDKQFIAIRRQVGSGYLEVEIQDAYDRQLTLRDAALELLQIRLADFRVNPLSFTVVGEYSQDAQKNIAALESAISRLVAMDDDLTETAGGTRIMMAGRKYPR